MIDQISSVGAAYGSQYAPKSQPLTADQQKTVQSILAQYDPTSLTAADAKNIFQSLTKAGINPSKDLMSTINRSCKITIGTLELLSLPLQLAGNNLLRGTLTARGKIPASGYNIACEIITNAA